MSDTIFLTFVSVRGICVKWFPTTDELTHLFTFPTSLTARDERIIMQHTKIFCFMLVLSTIDANNFFNPSPQSYLWQKFHFILCKSKIGHVIKQTTNVWKQRIVLHNFGIFFKLSKDCSLFDKFIHKLVFCFKNYTLNKTN